MRIKTLIAAATALSMVATPVLANPASPLSLGNAASVRAGAPTSKTSKLGGNAIVPVILALAIIAGGIYIAVDDNDKPDSA